jgi:hypothetical protein
MCGYGNSFPTPPKCLHKLGGFGGNLEERRGIGNSQRQNDSKCAGAIGWVSGTEFATTSSRPPEEHSRNAFTIGHFGASGATLPRGCPKSVYILRTGQTRGARNRHALPQARRANRHSIVRQTPPIHGGVNCKRRSLLAERGQRLPRRLADVREWRMTAAGKPVTRIVPSGRPRYAARSLTGVGPAIRTP